jgi:hypothetical protein
MKEHYALPWKGFLWEQLGVSSPNSQLCQSVTTKVLWIDFVWTKIAENDAPHIAIRLEKTNDLTYYIITSFRIFRLNYINKMIMSLALYEKKTTKMVYDKLCKFLS